VSLRCSGGRFAAGCGAEALEAAREEVSTVPLAAAGGVCRPGRRQAGCPGAVIGDATKPDRTRARAWAPVPGSAVCPYMSTEPYERLRFCRLSLVHWEFWVNSKNIEGQLTRCSHFLLPLVSRAIRVRFYHSCLRTICPPFRLGAEMLYGDE
jgi:hypothetical protein